MSIYYDVEEYEHHGVRVSVKSALKGKHREHCLCYICGNFKPDTEENCKIAHLTFKHNIKHGIVTPIYECPKWKEGRG